MKWPACVTVVSSYEIMLFLCHLQVNLPEFDYVITFPDITNRLPRYCSLPNSALGICNIIKGISVKAIYTT